MGPLEYIELGPWGPGNQPMPFGHKLVVSDLILLLWKVGWGWGGSIQFRRDHLSNQQRSILFRSFPNRVIRMNLSDERGQDLRSANAYSLGEASCWVLKGSNGTHARIRVGNGTFCLGATSV